MARRYHPTLSALATCLALASQAACGDSGDGDKDTATTPADTSGDGSDTAVESDTASGDDADTGTPPTDATTPDDVDATVPPDTADTVDSSEPDTADTADTGGDDTADTASDADVADDSDTSTGPELAGACPLESRLGGFQAVDDGEYGYTEGTVADAILPVSVLEVVATEGDCVLYRKNNPFCTPTCTGTDTCDYNGECIPYPVNQSLGTVSISGLAVPIAMEPVVPGNLYFATDVPYPPWSGGELVTLTSEPADLPALTLEGVAPMPFTPGDTLWTLTAGQPLTAHWDAPAGPVRTKVELQLLIDQHGNAPGSLRCNFDDDGEATVSAAMLDQLRGLGISGFPSGKLTRQTIDSTTVDLGGGESGCADFAVRMPRGIKVTVSGHIPCKKTADCPSPMVCDVPNETCVDP